MSYQGQYFRGGYLQTLQTRNRLNWSIFRPLPNKIYPPNTFSMHIFCFTNESFKTGGLSHPQYPQRSPPLFISHSRSLQKAYNMDPFYHIYIKHCCVFVGYLSELFQLLCRYRPHWNIDVEFQPTVLADILKETGIIIKNKRIHSAGRTAVLVTEF